MSPRSVPPGLARAYPGAQRRAPRVYPATAGAGALGTTLALWLRPDGLFASGWRRDDGGAAVTVTGATYAAPTASTPAGLSFDGVDDRVDGAISVAADSTCTVFVVASHDHTQTAAARGRLLDLSDTTATARSIQITDLFGQRRAERALGDDPGSASYTSASDAIKVTRAVFGANFTELYEDGLWRASSGLAIATRVPDRFRIGAALDGTFWWKGVVYEVRVYSGTVSEVDAERIEGELLDAYGKARPYRWPGLENTAAEDPQFLAPPILPAIAGQPVTIMRDQIHYSYGRRTATITTSLTVDSSRPDRWVVTPPSAGDYSVRIDEGAYSLTMTIRAVAALVGTTARRVTFIGDSNTERQATGAIEHFGKSLGAQVTMVGAYAASAGYSYAHCGAGGFTFGQFLIGTVVQSKVSPFWDGVAFNVVYFSELISGMPDVSFFGLGQNDVYSSTDGTIAANVATALANADTLYNGMIEAAPGMVAIFFVPPPGNGIPSRWDGETQRLQFRRNEQAMAKGLLDHFGGREAEGIHVLGSNFQFDCARGYVEEILHLNTSPGGRELALAFLAAYSVWYSEAAVVRIVSATVDGSDPDALVIVYNVAVDASTVTGYTLTGTTRTVSSVTSGSGTTTHTLALSGAISEADAPILHVGLTRTAASTSGSRKVVVGKTTVTKTNFVPLAIQLGAHTWLRTDDAGASLTLVGSDVSQWSDSSGNARHVAASTVRPSSVADFGDGAPSVHFDGAEIIYGANTLDLNSDFTIIALQYSSASGYGFGLTDAAEASTQEGLLMRVISNFLIGYLTQAGPTVQNQVNPTGNPGGAWRVNIFRRSGSTLKGRVGTGTEHTAAITAAGVGCTALALGGYRQNNVSVPSSAQDWREMQVYASHLSDAQITSVIADLQARYPSVP